MNLFRISAKSVSSNSALQTPDGERVRGAICDSFARQALEIRNTAYYPQNTDLQSSLSEKFLVYKNSATELFRRQCTVSAAPGAQSRTVEHYCAPASAQSGRRCSAAGRGRGSGPAGPCSALHPVTHRIPGLPEHGRDPCRVKSCLAGQGGGAGCPRVWWGCGTP